MTPLDHALQLAANGIPCFPCAPDKKPRISRDEGGRGFHDATVDPATLTAWWSRWSDSLVGVPTGAASGLYVLDIDVKDGRNGWGVLPEPLPPCRTHWTLTGGAHVLFAQPGGGMRSKTDSDRIPVPGSDTETLPGLDRRGDGGYIIWWPAHGGLVTEGPIAPAPAWMMAGVSAPAPAPVSDVPPIGLSDDELRAVLAGHDGSRYDGWVQAGMALHHETGGDERGLDLWDAVSQVWPGYPSGGREDLAAKWSSFGRHGGAPVTMRSILPVGWTRSPQSVGFGAGEQTDPKNTGTHIRQGVDAADRGATTGPAIPQAREVVGSTFLTPSEQVRHFAGCVYVTATNRVMAPDGRMLDKERFDVEYGGYAFGLDAANSKTAKGAWEAFTKSQAMRFPKADGACFRPEHPPGALVEDGGLKLVNTWSPVNVPSVPGDVGPFIDHMTRLLPHQGDREALLAYLAAVVQFPGDKFQWCPLIQGVEGNGKSLILSVIEAALGSRYCHRPNAADLGGNGGTFTAWLHGKILIGIEEIKTSHRLELLEILKPIVTNERIEIQAKGVDQVTGDNRANLILLSNHKDAITKSARDRRYAIYYTAQQEAGDLARDGMTGAYFPRLYGWLKGGGYAHVTHWLRSYAIPAELNPATNHGGLANRAPATSSHDEALAIGLGAIEQEVLEAVSRCDAGFCGGWVSSTALTELVRGMGGRAHLTPHKQKELLSGLGYVPHPSLPGGRANNPIAYPDGGSKPRLYVKAGHLSCNEPRPAEVVRMYVAAQPGGFGPGAAGQAVTSR